MQLLVIIVSVMLASPHTKFCELRSLFRSENVLSTRLACLSGISAQFYSIECRAGGERWGRNWPGRNCVPASRDPSTSFCRARLLPCTQLPPLVYLTLALPPQDVRGDVGSL